MPDDDRRIDALVEKVTPALDDLLYLETADGADRRVQIGNLPFQPSDTDLAAIAALTTTAYGRAFLALVDAAAARTALALGTAATQATGAFDAAGAATAAVAALVASTDPLGDRVYTDAQVASRLSTAFDFKASVLAATTANVTLSGTQTIDGVSVPAGARVLAKNQTSPAENGIWVAAAGAWARATDADQNAEVTAGLAVPVEQGTANAGRIFMLTTAGAITVGATGLTFTRVDAGDLSAAQNLADLTSATTARANLELGSAALLDATNVPRTTSASSAPTPGKEGDTWTDDDGDYFRAVFDAGNVLVWVEVAPDVDADALAVLPAFSLRYQPFTDYVFVPANEMDDAYLPPTKWVHGNRYPAWVFPADDAANVSGTLVLPPGWITMAVELWWWCGADTNGGNVFWYMEDRPGIAGATFDAGAVGFTFATPGALEHVLIHSAIGTVDCSASPLRTFFLQRLADNGLDTETNQAFLAGIMFRRLS